MKNNVFIIAEAGVNHNGDMKLAHQLVDAAVEAKADAVKFQSFVTEELIVKTAPKAQYQLKTTGERESQFEMLKKLELSFDQQKELKQYCQKRGIEFFSTAFDLVSLSYLINDLNVPYMKVASGEVSNAPLLLEMGRSRKPIILSTGLSTLADVQSALEVLSFGLTQDKRPASKALCRQSYVSTEGQALLREYVSILHCVSEYPAPFENVNLRSITTLANAFGLRVGYSDHTPGWSATVASVAIGATIIEKHLTIDKKLPGPDHAASLDPEEFKSMVQAIRETEKAMGHGLKIPCAAEIANKSVAQKSVVARGSIAKGTVFTKDNLTVKRPADGIPPSEIWGLMGQVATRDYSSDEPIKP